MANSKTRRPREVCADFGQLPYFGITLTQESAEKVANEYRMRGKRSMAEKDSVLAAANFSAALFTEFRSQRIRWPFIREVRDMLDRAADAHVAEVIKRPAKRRLPTAAQLRASVEW